MMEDDVLCSPSSIKKRKFIVVDFPHKKAYTMGDVERCNGGTHVDVVVICQNTLLVEVIRQCMMKKKINTECIHTYRTIDQFYNDEHLNISLFFIEKNSTFDVSNLL
ncbi:TPA: hypothetical protein ACSPZ7_004342, partial [Aeromonas veronii]